jgi:hypothetical protein
MLRRKCAQLIVRAQTVAAKKTLPSNGNSLAQVLGWRAAQPYSAALHQDLSSIGRDGRPLRISCAAAAMAYLLHCNAPGPTAASTYCTLEGRLV